MSSTAAIKRFCVAFGACVSTLLLCPNVAHAETNTPIEHVVVIYAENISFDHYFATYPKAENNEGAKQQGTDLAAPQFEAKKDTPKVNNLASEDLLGDKNPNSVKPFRLSPDQAATVDQNHEYSAEQQAANNGKMDKFPETVSSDVDKKNNGYSAKPGLTMGYYDGNTVTGMWNYAQNFALNDNSYSTIFGPSTPGAINLIVGTVAGATMHDPASGEQVKIEPGKSSALAGVAEDGSTTTIVADPDPLYDDCSNASSASTDQVAAFSNKNIGDQLNENNVTWGWFQGGFRPLSLPRKAAGRAAELLTTR